MTGKTIIQKINELINEVKDVGKIKNGFSRLGSYVGVVNMLLLVVNLSLTAKLSLKLSIIFFIIICILAIIIIVIDRKYIYEREQEYVTNKNPVFTEIRQNIDDIKKKLEVQNDRELIKKLTDKIDSHANKYSVLISIDEWKKMKGEFQ